MFFELEDKHLESYMRTLEEKVACATFGMEDFARLRQEIHEAFQRQQTSE